MARGILPGSIDIRFLTTVPATLTAPTQAELSAGLDVVGSELNEELAEMTGWVITNNTIPTPGFNSNRVGQVGGDQTYDTSSMKFYKDSSVHAIFDALIDGTTGWMAIMDDGQASGKFVQVFPCQVLTRVRSKDRGPKTFTCNFAIQAPAVGVQGA